MIFSGFFTRLRAGTGFALLLLSLVHGGASAAESDALTEAVVIFNTVCAKCHEAQCSGRLSFGESLEQASGHITRYYDQASGKKWLQKELFNILNHMKVKCAYYPMNVVVPKMRIWSGPLLDRMSTLLKKYYFIPLGGFSPGEYRLEMELEEDTKAVVHLVSESFEMAIEDCHQSTGKRLSIPFSIEEKGNYYFRMYPYTPVRIMHLAITTAEEIR